jgi:hypothetical protein
MITDCGAIISLTDPGRIAGKPEIAPALVSGSVLAYYGGPSAFDPDTGDMHAYLATDLQRAGLTLGWPECVSARSSPRAPQGCGGPSDSHETAGSFGSGQPFTVTHKNAYTPQGCLSNAAG